MGPLFSITPEHLIVLRRPCMFRLEEIFKKKLLVNVFEINYRSNLCVENNRKNGFRKFCRAVTYDSIMRDKQILGFFVWKV